MNISLLNNGKSTNDINEEFKQTVVPTKILHNLNIIIDGKKEIMDFPLSTYETPLFASISRGCKVSCKCPIVTKILSDCMTRSVIFQCENIIKVSEFVKYLQEKQKRIQELQKIVLTTSSHCELLNIELQVVGKLVYARFSYNTNEASGHNMTTIATNEIAKFIVKKAHNIGINVEYLSNSSNTCTDKKVSAINSICKRGKHVVAEIVIKNDICKEVLHTTPEKIVQLNIKKNLIGSILAGSLCSANAHYANMLAAIYLPFGQDIANVIEGSQGITYCEIDHSNNLYFSVNLPNIICGSIGNGKDLDFVRENFKTIKCYGKDNRILKNASLRFASIIGAVVLCGELSLMASLTNENELVRSHTILERKKNIKKKS